MGAILTVTILTVYACCIGVLFTRYRAYFYVIVLILLSLNDVIFVPLSDWMDPALLLISKAWKEIFILGVVAYGVLNQKSGAGLKISKNTLRCIAVIVILSVLAIGVGLSRSSLVDAIQQWRRYFVPYFLALALASVGISTRLSVKTLVRAFIAISCIMAIFSLYKFATFSGDYRKLWYYNFVALAKESIQTDARLIQYQFVRGDQLRASGFFTSAIEYSLFNAFALTFSTIMLFTTRSQRERLVLIPVTLLLIFGEFSANVRIGWVVYALSIIGVIQLDFFKTRSFWKLAVVPFFILLLTFALIITQKTELDASSVGRLAQYATVPSDFRLQGYGLGKITNNGEVYKDSWYISVAMVFGVASILYAWLIFEPLQYSLKRIRADGEAFERGGEYSFMLVVVSFFMAQIYVFGFHYSTGLSHIYVSLIFLFCLKYRLMNKAAR